MTERNQASIIQTLYTNIDISMLVYFRIVFGITIFSWATKTLLSGAVDEFYVLPRLHFTYNGFSWVRPLANDGMRYLFIVLAGSGLAVALGIFYRVTALVLAISFSYVFLLDKVCYLNHYYLLCLVSWCMVIVPAHRAGSVDVSLRPNLHTLWVPAWTLYLIRFQIALPYFYGGIAKLSSDWLQGQPMRDTLAARADMPLIGELLGQEWVLWMFCYGGLVFDLLVVPALLWRRTRPWAFALAVLFHLINSMVFPIGVFPWFMILATVVFFPSDFLRKLFHSQAMEQESLNNLIPEPNEDIGSICWRRQTIVRKVGLLLLGFYVVLQLMLPFRHLAYAGNVNWNEAGHRFAWHMMLRGKLCGVRYYAVDRNGTRSVPIDLRPYLSEYQVARFGRDPIMIEQLARYLGDDLRGQRFSEEVEIRVLALVSLNGRKPQLMIDPTVDLANQPTTNWWQTPSWVLPLEEPLRNPGWDVPLKEWERHVDVPALMQVGS